jgi:hypothetical protein
MAINLGTLSRYLGGIADSKAAQGLRRLLEPVLDRYASVPTSTAALVIKAGASTLAKNGSVFHGFAAGVPVTIAANTDMPALPGTITANAFNCYCFFIDRASTVTVAQGIEGSTRALMKFPPFPRDKCLIGYLIVTHSSTFTGGTTALDTATTQYISPTGAFDPSVRL